MIIPYRFITEFSDICSSSPDFSTHFFGGFFFCTDLGGVFLGCSFFTFISFIKQNCLSVKYGLALDRLNSGPISDSMVDARLERLPQDDSARPTHQNGAEYA